MFSQPVKIIPIVSLHIYLFPNRIWSIPLIPLHVSPHAIPIVRKISFATVNYRKVVGKCTLARWGPGARFLKVPKTFRARKAICEIANRLFWKADLLTCFQGNKKKNNCELWRIKCSPFLSYKGNCDTRKWPVKFRDFWETAPWCYWAIARFSPVHTVFQHSFSIQFIWWRVGICIKTMDIRNSVHGIKVWSVPRDENSQLSLNMVSPELTISSRRLDLITRDQCLTQQLFSV